MHATVADVLHRGGLDHRSCRNGLEQDRRDYLCLGIVELIRPEGVRGDQTFADGPLLWIGVDQIDAA